MKNLFLLCCCSILLGNNKVIDHPAPAKPFIIVLGIAQDAGYPQIGCDKSCCLPAWKDPSKKRMVSSLALAKTQTDRMAIQRRIENIK